MPQIPNEKIVSAVNALLRISDIFLLGTLACVNFMRFFFFNERDREIPKERSLIIHFHFHLGIYEYIK